MIRKAIVAPLLAATAIVTAVTTFADGHGDYEAAIDARQSVMKIYAFNLGILGDMAKGETPYDAGAASAAASNLVAAAGMDTRAMWPRGSDAAALGEETTKARAELWQNFAEAGEHGQALTEATAAMAAASGDGLNAVRANIGAIGDSCKGCHESFRITD